MAAWTAHPQLCQHSGHLTHEVRNRLPPTGEVSILQQWFKKCPSQFTALFNRAFDFLQSENCLHTSFLKVIGTLGSGKFSSLFQDQQKNQARQWVFVGERYASLLEAEVRRDLPVAKRRVFMVLSRLLLRHILWCNVKLKGGKAASFSYIKANNHFQKSINLIPLVLKTSHNDSLLSVDSV